MASERRIGVPLIFFTVLLAMGCGSEASGETTGQDSTLESLSPSSLAIDGVQLQWAVSGTNLELTVSAPTTGWVAIGFEPTTAMKDADIIIGYVSAGEVFIRDDWGDGYTSHTADSELGGTDNVTLLSGTEENGVTELSFSIPLSSGDVYDHVLEASATCKILIAYGPEGADNFSGYHAWAETMEIVIN